MIITLDLIYKTWCEGFVWGCLAGGAVGGVVGTALWWFL